MSNRAGAISTRRRITWGAILVVVVVGPILGRRAIETHLFPHRPVVVPAPPTPFGFIVLIVLGAALVVAALVVYGIVLLTGCFTFDYRRPFMRTFGRKLLLATLLTIGLLSNGISLILAPFLTAALWAIIPGTAALEIGWFVPLVASILVLLLWFQIWAPLERIVVHRRMRALGVHPERIAAGMPIGTTDPDRKRRRLFAGVVEEDMGTLWFDAEQLLYFGDLGPWAITRDQLISIDRLAHTKAVSSHFGAVHVVLRFRRPDGGEGRVCLHTQGNWTQTARARALDDLADRLASWRSGAIPQPPAIGFAVVDAHANQPDGTHRPSE